MYQETFGKTPLHYAVESGQTPTVTFLIQHEANVNAQDGKGKHLYTLLLEKVILKLFKCYCITMPFETKKKYL